MAAQPKQQRSSILLVDDDEQTAKLISRRLEKHGFKCHVSSDPQEVLELVDNLDLVLTDIRMDRMDGVELTRRIKAINPHIPVAALTAYMHVNPWSSELREAEDIFADVLQKPFPSDPRGEFLFCQRLDEIVGQSKYRELDRQNPGEDPFEISFQDFLGMDREEAMSVRERAWDMKEEWFLRQVEEENLNWVVFCGDRVVRTSSDGGPIPARDEMIAYGEEYGRIPFLFVRPPIVEESSWAKTKDRQVGSGADDYYPTLECTVEHDGNSHSLVGDFDTGALVSCIGSDIVPIDQFDPLGKGRHLGVEYKYTIKPIKLLLKDEGQNIHAANLDVYVIEDWWGKKRKSPFLMINPGRCMLVGRDVLQVFNMLRFTLDPSQRKTFIDP